MLSGHVKLIGVALCTNALGKMECFDVKNVSQNVSHRHLKLTQGIKGREEPSPNAA